MQIPMAPVISTSVAAVAKKKYPNTFLPRVGEINVMNVDASTSTSAAALIAKMLLPTKATAATTIVLQTGETNGTH